MTIKRIGSSLEMLFGLAVMVLFAVLSFMLVLLGKNTYTQIADNTEQNHELRILTSYIANKVRSGDSADNIQITNQVSSGVLSIGEEDGEFRTCIYFYNGMLKEQLIGSNDTFTPENGEDLLAVSAFDCSLNNGLVNFSVQDKGGKSIAMHVRLRSS